MDPTRSPSAAQIADAALSASEPGSAATGAIQLVNLVLRHLPLVVLTGAVFAVVAGALSMMRSRTYTSNASFTPQSATPDRGGVASLAASFGISVAGGSAAESPQFYADLLSSDEILRRVAAKNFALSGGAPSPLAQLLKINVADPERRLFETVKQMRRMIVVRASARTGVVSVSVTAPSPALAQQLSDSLTASVNAFNLQSQQSRAGSERQFTEGRLREYQAELQAVEATYEEFLRSNRQNSAPSLQLQNDRLQRRITMLQSVVTSLTSAYEQARIDEVRSTPAIRMIERPRAPVEPNGRGTLKIVLLVGIVGALLGLMFAVVSERLRHAQGQGDPNIEELLRTGRRLLPRGLSRRA